MKVSPSLVVLGIVLATLTGMAHGQNAIDAIRSSGKITIAYRESSIPFSYLNSDGKPVGYAIDLCLKIVDALKQDLKLPHLETAWLPVTSASRIPAIVDGKAQLECGSTTNTAKRREQVSFTIPHFISSARFLVRANSGITRIDDLRGKTVVSTKGTTNIRYLSEQDDQRLLHWKVIAADEHAQAFQMVESGTADAFEMDDILLYGLKAESAHPDNFQVVGENLSVEPYAIMLPKNDPEFKRLVDAEMLRLINSFEIFPIYKKWFESPIPPKGVNLKLPMPFLLHDSLRYPSDQVPG